MAQTTTANEGNVEYNKETGELVLSGKITKELVDHYRPEFDVQGNEIPTETPVTSIRCEPGCILPADCSDLFWAFEDCKSIDLSLADTSHVVDMYAMFSVCPSLKTLNLSSFDTSSVTNMSLMFYRCSSLKALDISSFDTSNVKDMSYMFYYCDSILSLNFSSFDTSNVEDMLHMFAVCSSLETVKLGAPQDGKQDSLRAELKASVHDCPLAKIEYAYPLPENKELVQTIENTRELSDTPHLTQKEKDWILAQEEPVSMKQVCRAKSAGADLTALDAQELSRFAATSQKSAIAKQSERKPAR